jgi:hypothetical protein
VRDFSYLAHEGRGNVDQSHMRRVLRDGDEDDKQHTRKQKTVEKARPRLSVDLNGESDGTGGALRESSAALLQTIKRDFTTLSSYYIVLVSLSPTTTTGSVPELVRCHLR